MTVEVEDMVVGGRAEWGADLWCGGVWLVGGRRCWGSRGRGLHSRDGEAEWVRWLEGGVRVLDVWWCLCVASMRGLVVRWWEGGCESAWVNLEPWRRMEKAGLGSI